MKRFEILASNGRLVLCDSSLKYVELVDINKDTCERKYLYLINGEGAFPYDIGVVSEVNSTMIEKFYERENGYFGINITSGKLVLCTENEWKSNKIDNDICFESGSYRASVFTYELRDYLEYQNCLVNKIGENNIKFYEVVDKIGLLAWGITIASIISLFTDIGQEYWLIPFAFWFFVWYLFFKLLNTNRYQKIDKIRMKYENKFPHYIIHLEPVDGNIPGGVQHLHF